MSNLLEQAIIDAAALKEVAIKNAEAALIEKYSKEFKDSVEKLLEQEEIPQLDASAAPIADPMAQTATTAKPEAIKNVPSSFLEGDDEELITIDFDQIKKEVEKALGVQADEEMPSEEATEQNPEALETPEQQALAEQLEIDDELLSEAYDSANAESGLDMTHDALYEEEQTADQLEEELLQFLEEDATTVASKAQLVSQDQAKLAKDQQDLENEKIKNAQIAGQKAKTVAAQQVEEEIDLDEEALASLEEELKVDLEPEHQLRGYMGTTTVEKKLARNVELAKARDQKEKDARAKEKQEMADLQEQLAQALKENKKLAITFEEFKKVLTQLKEHTEKLSVSNAKLLYTNKILENNSLNERQKEQIVESISKSTSVLEAKTIYNTLQSTVQRVSEKKTKESLSEAIIRGSNSPFLVRQKQVSSQDESISQRMQILAGIKNKN
jgi:hypothetical protein